MRGIVAHLCRQRIAKRNSSVQRSVLIKRSMSDATCTEDFPKPVVKNGRFEIPWKLENGERAVRPSIFKVAHGFFMDKDNNPKVPSAKELDNVPGMQICVPQREKLLQPPLEQIQTTWLGHASFLVQLGGMNVLFDPVFSNSIGPVRFAGQKRFRKCPMKVADLPEIDVVCISHDHYDHCDLPSIKELHKRFGASIRWCVPLGLDDWLKRQLGVDEVITLGFNWWDSKRVHVTASATKTSNTDWSLQVGCVPAQHWCVRGLNSWCLSDENSRLWSGWVVKSSNPDLSVYHAGDTGYCKIFKSIGKKHGPIDLALIPIGAYCPRHVMSFQHVDPEEAVLIHEDVKARQSVGMHWGTFSLTNEFYLEPPEKLREVLDSKKIPQDQFRVLKHGETITVSGVTDCLEHEDGEIP